jgi:hypothetical protein
MKESKDIMNMTRQLGHRILDNIPSIVVVVVSSMSFPLCQSPNPPQMIGLGEQSTEFKLQRLDRNDFDKKFNIKQDGGPNN